MSEFSFSGQNIDTMENKGNQDSKLHTVLGVLKGEKKNVKFNNLNYLTQMLNQLAVLVLDEKYDTCNIVEVNRMLGEVER